MVGNVKPERVRNENTGGWTARILSKERKWKSKVGKIRKHNEVLYRNFKQVLEMERQGG